ncbi:KR domain-containing protein [Trichoderma sp. SZMC 28011]
MSLVSILPGWWWVAADVANPSAEPVPSAKKTITLLCNDGERQSSNLSAKAMQSTTIGAGNIFSFCGVDGFEKSLIVALDVFAKFKQRRGDGVVDSDNEQVDGRNGSRGPASARGARLASLNWVPREQKHLTSEEIEIKLHAIDLNFKCHLGCPLRAVNDIPCPDEGVGTEDAGMIRRVGPRVRTLRPDDPVMTVKAGIFTAHVIILKKLCVQSPDNISFQDATAMTTVFSTVAESMFNVAHLEKVHREAWASAIQLVKKVGAAMYATVGKGEKVKFLMDEFNIPRSHTYLHHDTRFVEGATRENSGRGVDAALNFLSSLSLSAGDGPDDVYFVRQLESLGFAVELVKVSVFATNLKGILQTSMVRGTRDLHDITCQANIKILPGQSNYASATTYLDSFVQYKTALGLRASCIDLGAVQDAGCVANDEALLKRRNLANTSGVSDYRRIMAYHNASIESDDSSGVSSDFLEILFVKVKKNSSILKSRDAGGILPIEIGKRLLFMFLLKSEDDPDVSTSLAALDSPVGIEMRSWWQKKRDESAQPYTKHKRRSDTP